MLTRFKVLLNNMHTIYVFFIDEDILHIFLCNARFETEAKTMGPQFEQKKPILVEKHSFICHLLSRDEICGALAFLTNT